MHASRFSYARYKRKEYCFLYTLGVFIKIIFLYINMLKWHPSKCVQLNCVYASIIRFSQAYEMRSFRLPENLVSKCALGIYITKFLFDARGAVVVVARNAYAIQRSAYLRFSEFVLVYLSYMIIIIKRNK